MTTTPLKPCPCGKIPTELTVTEGSTFRWRYVSGGCCGWMIECRVNTMRPKSEQADYEECAEAWNDQERALQSTDVCILCKEKLSYTDAAGACGNTPETFMHPGCRKLNEELKSLRFKIVNLEALCDQKSAELERLHERK